MNNFSKDIIITGIPRGGTTLATALLDNLEDVICLSEPSWQNKWFKNIKDINVLKNLVAHDFKKIRKQIIDGSPIKDIRNKDGTPITNYFNANSSGQRINVSEQHEVIFQVKDENFLLGMKHNAHYTSILPQLIETNLYSIIAIVRHPVPTILSWKSLNLPISHGRLPAGEKHWKELRNITRSKDKSLLQLIRIYDLFCQRYLELSKDIHLLKYEEIIKNPFLFEQITGRTFKEKIVLSNQNKSKNYNFSLADEIREKITLHAPYALKLYSMNDET